MDGGPICKRKVAFFKLKRIRADCRLRTTEVRLTRHNACFEVGRHIKHNNQVAGLGRPN